MSILVGLVVFVGCHIFLVLCDDCLGNLSLRYLNKMSCILRLGCDVK